VLFELAHIPLIPVKTIKLNFHKCTGKHLHLYIQINPSGIARAKPVPDVKID
jgi:hypothetical protein